MGEHSFFTLSPPSWEDVTAPRSAPPFLPRWRHVRLCHPVAVREALGPWGSSAGQGGTGWPTETHSPACQGSLEAAGVMDTRAEGSLSSQRSACLPHREHSGVGSQRLALCRGSAPRPGSTAPRASLLKPAAHWIRGLVVACLLPSSSPFSGPPPVETAACVLGSLPWGIF